MQQKEECLYCNVALCQKCSQEAEWFHISVFRPSQTLESEKWSPSTDGRETSSCSRLYVPQERRFPAVWALTPESPESNYSLPPGLVLSCLDTAETVEMTIYHLSVILPSDAKPTNSSTNSLLADSSLPDACSRVLHYPFSKLVYHFTVLTYC